VHLLGIEDPAARLQADVAVLQRADELDQHVEELVLGHALPGDLDRGGPVDPALGEGGVELGEGLREDLEVGRGLPGAQGAAAGLG
jgi:hypothetical protein